MDNFDHFGFYEVDNLKFYSRFDAEQVAAKSNKPLHWNFNDQFFSQCKWHIEPTETLQELYTVRAQQLREQYDYLVLWYSGGADSENILTTFVDNGIKLDEVASYVNYDATKDKHSWLNAEIYDLAIPRVAQIKEAQQPCIKHTIVDLSTIMMDFFKKRANTFDWIYEINSYLGPNNIARTHLLDYQPAWKEMMDQGKKVGFIWGVDKPRVVGIKDRFFMTFSDTVDQALPNRHQYNRTQGFFNELFYWHPSCANMLAKQAHIVKKFLTTVEPSSEYLTSKYLPRNSVGIVGNQIKYITNEGVNRLIYPKWQKVPYQEKPPSIVFTERDKWFYNLPDSDAAKSAWKNGLLYRWQQTDERFRKDPTDIVKGFKILYSKFYSLTAS
jgi:hypothetical protein